MAIDTAAKRFSILDADVPSSPATPPPTGAVGAGPRFHHMWLYSGITGASTELLPTDCRTVTPFAQSTIEVRC